MWRNNCWNFVQSLGWNAAATKHANRAFLKIYFCDFMSRESQQIVLTICTKNSDCERTHLLGVLLRTSLWNVIGIIIHLQSERIKRHFLCGGERTKIGWIFCLVVLAYHLGYWRFFAHRTECWVIQRWHSYEGCLSWLAFRYLCLRSFVAQRCAIRLVSHFVQEFHSFGSFMALTSSTSFLPFGRVAKELWNASFWLSSTSFLE